MNQLDTLGRIINLINEAMLDDECWQETSQLIDEALAVHGNVLMFGEGMKSDSINIYFAKWYTHGQYRSDFKQDYFQNYHQADERLPRLRRLPDSKIVPIRALYSKAERKTSPTYNEALPCYYAQNGLDVRLDGPDGTRIVWAIADPLNSNSWSTHQIDLVKRLLPHLRQYVRVRSVLVEAEALGASVTGLLDNMQTGVIQLDRRGSIVDMNDTARQLVREKDGLYDQEGSLHATRPKDDLKLKALLARALPQSSLPGVSGSMVVRRSSSQSLLALHVKPVSSREKEFRSRNVAAFLMVAGPDIGTQIDPKFVETVLGLTPAEAEIAVLLARGHTARQIASITGRSYSTVRYHLKHIFSKLGLTRQIEVAQTVLALASLPQPED